MFCAWGSIVFEAEHITAFSENGGPAYAEHALIGRKPKLQCTGDELRTLELTIQLHFMRSGSLSATEPQRLVDQLTSAVNSHQPAPFSWADGTYEGLFVGDSMSLTREMTDAAGRLLSAVYTLELKEYVDTTAAKKAPAVKSSDAAAAPSTAQKAAASTAKVSGKAPSQSKAATAAKVVRQGGRQ